MGRHAIQVRYRPVEGVAPTHLLRAFTAATEDQDRPPGDRDDELVDLAAIADRLGIGPITISPGSATCRPDHPTGQDAGVADAGLLLEFTVVAPDGVRPDAVQDAARSFATATLQRRLGGRPLVELDQVTLDLDQARIDLTEQGAASATSSD